MAHGSTRGSLTEGAWLTLRALAALLLAIGFYVAVLTLVGVLLFIAGTGLFYGKLLFLKVALFLLAAAGAILWAIWPHRDHFDPPWPTLDRKEAPRLFALIDEVAAATRQRPPRTVYLIPDANAWVMQRGGTLGVGGRRVMGLGLTLMAVVTELELRAILAHEFGHFHRGDTRLGPLIYRTRAAMGRTIAVLEDHVVVLQWVFIAYGKLYLALTHRISRHQELLADALAASIAGRRAMSDALTKTLGAGVVSDTYWSGDVVPLLKRGFLPPLAEGFRQFLRTERVAEAMHAAETEARSEQSGGRYDTHPPLGERLKALERIPDVALVESGPALALLADPAARERDLVRAMLEPERASALQQVTWEETPSRVMMPWYAEVSQAYHPYFGGMVLADVPSRTRGLAITLGDRADKDEGVTSPEMIPSRPRRLGRRRGDQHGPRAGRVEPCRRARRDATVGPRRGERGAAHRGVGRARRPTRRRAVVAMVPRTRDRRSADGYQRGLDSADTGGRRRRATPGPLAATAHGAGANPAGLSGRAVLVVPGPPAHHATNAWPEDRVPAVRHQAAAPRVARVADK